MKEIKKLMAMARRMKEQRRLNLLATMKPASQKKFKLLLKETGEHKTDIAEQGYGTEI
jgi:hypothetical protein